MQPRLDHGHHNGNAHGPKTIKVTFHLEDPQALTDSDRIEVHLLAAKGENLLDVALDNGINIEHACGGVCACSTCHIYIEDGSETISEPTEDEDDRVEEATGLQINSRLACQCEIERDGVIVLRVPAWNRNAVKEVPH